MFLAASAAYLAISATKPVMAQEKIANGKADLQQIERGRYLVKVTGCNDCHTAGYAMSSGKIPESQWLMGDRLGWRGPWGTTYPGNLRLFLSSLTQDQWVHLAKSMQPRPPMPWWALHDMNQQDLKALYAYVKWLGPAGELAPNYVPPEEEPVGPVVQFPAPPKRN
jgi:mono/diheme cytochrome c family protein